MPSKLFGTQKGRSMVEMIGVLAIAGFLSVGGILGYLRASKVMRVNAIKDEISTLVANIRSMHIAHDTYSTLNNTVLFGAGIVPEKYISKDKNQIINPLKGTVLVGTAQTDLSETGAFVLVFNGLDAVTCRELCVVDWGADISSGFLGLTVKNDGDLTPEESNLLEKDIPSESPTFRVSDLPLSVGSAYDVCNCGNLNTCAVAWKFL